MPTYCCLCGSGCESESPEELAERTRSDSIEEPATGPVEVGSGARDTDPAVGVGREEATGIRHAAVREGGAWPRTLAFATWEKELRPVAA